MASQEEQKLLLLSKLEKTESEWSSNVNSTIYKYQGFWYEPSFLDGVMKAQELQPTELGRSPLDVVLCSSLKTGTTWLKALAFSIVTRTQFEPNSSQDHPLKTSSPHDLIPYIETKNIRNRKLPLLSTHMPYSALPKSLLADSDPGCKIVYIFRDPKDTFVSLWNFLHKIWLAEVIPFDKAFDLFCQGVYPYGPYWDHVLGYWKASLDHLERVLILKYEDMMEDAGSHVRRLADFMGYPFSEEEEREGIPARIVDLCSFGSLSKLNTADKNLNIGSIIGPTTAISKSLFFRKGAVGDWRNHLTDEMAARIDAIFLDKLGGSGLTM